ncbi:MAG: lipoprotein [Gammaproteobacteria bacterium]|jgi:predicted small lipoprotein YifL
MRLIALIILLPTLYALAACGQKGPLTLPPDEEARATTVVVL